MAVQEITVNEARERLDSGVAELVDIREPGERKSLKIPGARWIPLAGLEAGLLVTPGEKAGIFHCRSGRRTRDHADTLAAIGYPETYVLKGGIMEWKKAGFPVESEGGPPIEIMRQVQIAAGRLILLGFVFGMRVHPNFYWLSGAIGAGLVYAGVSGSCGMAMMLGKLPFNR